VLFRADGERAANGVAVGSRCLADAAHEFVGLAYHAHHDADRVEAVEPVGLRQEELMSSDGHFLRLELVLTLAWLPP